MAEYIAQLPPPEDADPWLVLETFFQRLTGDPFWYHACQGAILSPPYNAGVPYSGGLSDNMALKDYVGFGKDLASMLDWVLEPGAQVFINLKPVMSNPLMVLHFITHGLLHDESPWKIENWITWQFSGTTPAGSGIFYSWGHFTPSAHGNRLHNTWEWVLHLRRYRDPAPKLNKLALGVEYVDQSNVKRFGAPGRPNRRCRGNHWAIPYRTKKNRQAGRHPAQFPAELASHCLALMDLPQGARVIDPCGGVQNTGVACGARGLRYVGCEVSPQYCAEGREKLKEAYGQ